MKLIRRAAAATSWRLGSRDNGHPRKTAESPGRRSSPSLPACMPLGQFLFEYLYRSGVRHSFGVPGDFALPTFACLAARPSARSP